MYVVNHHPSKGVLMLPVRYTTGYSTVVWILAWIRIILTTESSLFMEPDDSLHCHYSEPDT